MFAAMLEGLLLLVDPRVMVMILIGVVISQIVAVIPGLSGIFILSLMVPFAVVQDPVPGIALLIATATASATGNTVTSIFFAVPGSGSGVASIFDGHPMAKRGEGRRALAAGLTASAVGGVIGAIAMVAILPAVRPIVLSLGPPEFFVLTLIAIVFIGFIAEAGLLRSLVSGGLGLLLGLVGLEPGTSAPRFTMGEFYLWDGIPLVPFMLGLFAVAEMMSLMREGGTIIPAEAPTTGTSGTKQGILDVFRHWRVTLRSSVLGVGVGLLPGLGGAAAQFLAYGNVANHLKGKTEHEFGQGAIEGVIAADAATNSKDGGTLIPTLAFGIPGSASMAILLGAFLMLGIQPGRSLLEGEGLAIVWMSIWILVFSNLLSTSLVMSVAGPLARLATTRGTILVPVILCTCLFGAYLSTLHLFDIVTLFVFGIFGFYLKKYGFSRATMVIGFVLAPLAERSLFLAYNIHGWSLLGRPVVVGLLIMATLSLLRPAIKQQMSRRSRTKRPSSTSAG